MLANLACVTKRELKVGDYSSQIKCTRSFVCNSALVVKREDPVPWNEARMNAENKERYKQLCLCVWGVQWVSNFWRGSVAWRRKSDLTFCQNCTIVVIVNDRMVLLYNLLLCDAHKAVTVLFAKEVTFSYVLQLYTYVT